MFNWPNLIKICFVFSILVCFALAGEYPSVSSSNLCSTGTSTCTFTIATVQAGDALIVAVDSLNTISVSSITDNGGSPNNYVHCPNCSVINTTIASHLDAYYVLSANGGQTNITVNLSGTNTAPWSLNVLEVKYKGTSLSYDTSNVSNDTTSQTTHTGLGLTLTPGGTDMVVQMVDYGTSLAVSSISSPYTTFGTTGLNTAYSLNTDPSQSGVAPTWTMNGPSQAIKAAIAFTENCSAPSLCERPILNGSSGAQTSSYNTATFTPVANRFTLVTVRTSLASGNGPNMPTVSGDGLTWSLAADLPMGAVQGTGRSVRLTTYCGMGVSPINGAVTIDFAGQLQGTLVAWIVGDVRNTATSCASAIIQSPSFMSGITGTNSGSVTMSAETAGDSTWAAATLVGTAPILTASGGMFMIQQNNAVRSLGSEYSYGSATAFTPSMTWTGTATAYGMIALEIAPAIVTPSSRVKHRSVVY